MGDAAVESGEGGGMAVQEGEGFRGREELAVELVDLNGVVHEVDAEDGARGGEGAGGGFGELFGDEGGEAVGFERQKIGQRGVVGAAAVSGGV